MNPLKHSKALLVFVNLCSILVTSSLKGKENNLLDLVENLSETWSYDARHGKYGVTNVFVPVSHRLPNGEIEYQIYVQQHWILGSNENDNPVTSYEILSYSHWADDKCEILKLSPETGTEDPKITTTSGWKIDGKIGINGSKKKGIGGAVQLGGSHSWTYSKTFTKKDIEVNVHPQKHSGAGWIFILTPGTPVSKNTYQPVTQFLIRGKQKDLGREHFDLTCQIKVTFSSGYTITPSHTFRIQLPPDPAK